MRITVFTPTYNRADLLPILYNSLLQQTNSDFEWVIVDDGSTDTTENMVKEWIIENKIIINYHKQKNGGKHRAINKGVALAEGELFFIVDSDDYLKDNALLVIKEEWQKVKLLGNKENFLGISGHRITEDGNVIGNSLPSIILDTDMSTLRYKYFISGDKAEAFRTDILKSNPFPEVKGEKFCSEGVIWHYLSQYYIIRYLDMGYYVCKYLPGGLTDNSVALRYSSPGYSSILYSTIIKNKKIPALGRIKAAINYWRFKSFNTTTLNIVQVPLWAKIFLPLGKILHLKDKFELNEKI